MNLTQAQKDEFCDVFYGNFQKLVPEHLRPRLSVFHLKFMVEAFFEALAMMKKEDKAKANLPRY